MINRVLDIFMWVFTAGVFAAALVWGAVCSWREKHGEKVAPVDEEKSEP